MQQCARGFDEIGGARGLQNVSHLGMLVGISSEYFEDVERFKLNAATAIAQRIHNNLRVKVSANEKTKGFQVW